jgi:mRNA interferase RelE/StbE
MAIRGLSENPRPRGVMKMKGSKEGYRIRVGNFRVIYEVYDDENKVVISHVLRRNETTYRV